MARNDAYNNKDKYEKTKANIKDFLLTPKERVSKSLTEEKRLKGHKAFRNDTYYCKNPANLKYFQVLFDRFEAKDLSYIRRIRVINSFKLICHATDKELSSMNQREIDKVVAFMHTRYNSVAGKKDFIKNLKCIWRILFPEIDSKERPDSTIVPYAVRHLKSTDVHKSQEVAREMVTPADINKIFTYFSNRPQDHCFLTLLYDAFLRPQEALYLRIKDIEIQDKVVLVHVRHHGKEGTGMTWVEGGYLPVINWYDIHPYRSEGDQPFFFPGSNNTKDKYSLTTLKRRLKICCKEMNIKKRVTLYDFNRAGITHALVRGVPPTVIQKKRRWSNLKQLKNYDYTQTKDIMRSEMIRLGLIEPENKIEEMNAPLHKDCVFCNKRNNRLVENCVNCKRPLDRKKIEQKMQQQENILSLDIVKQLAQLQRQINEMKA
jgi:integrase